MQLNVIQQLCQCASEDVCGMVKLETEDEFAKLYAQAGAYLALVILGLAHQPRPTMGRINLGRLWDTGWLPQYITLYRSITMSLIWLR